jgi:hypothetical protein
LVLDHGIDGKDGKHRNGIIGFNAKPQRSREAKGFTINK